jgi:translation initiation factor 2 subunit 3
LFIPRKKADVKNKEGVKVKEKKQEKKLTAEKKAKLKKAEAKAQPEINIGLVGHVDHGKTTLIEALTGKWADTHSEEIKRGITIRLGYADATFRKCLKCPEPAGYITSETCSCGSKAETLRKVSFVDAPGHESLMATMISGATMMDGALLLVAANEPCPQPQTREHLMALEIIGIKNVVVVQNKIDIVSKEEAKKNYHEIKEFLKDTSYRSAPVIPLSAQQRTNLDLLIKAIQDFIPTPKRDPNKEAVMFVARSFDINKPGSDPVKMVGGVLGGALKQGVLRLNDEIEIRPGRKVEKGGKILWQPMRTKIAGLKTGGTSVKEIAPGGSVGVLTLLDPAIVKADALAGAVAGRENLPPVWSDLKLETHLLERVVGSKDKLVVEAIKPNETLMLNVNSAATVGFVTKLEKKQISCKLKLPVCAEIGSRVTISRMIGNRWRLIGYGIIKE